MIAIDIDPITIPTVTDAQLRRVHAELEEITSAKLFGENATERARRLWSEDKLHGAHIRNVGIPQNVLAGKGQGT